MNEEDMLVQKFMDDPDFEHGDEPKEDVARAMAKQYIRQMTNTRAALAMAKAYLTKEEYPIYRPTPQGGMNSGNTGSAINYRSPITLSLEEMDFEQLEKTRLECEEYEKGWTKKGWRNVALAYREKMFDIDREVDRRAQEELKRLQGERNAKGY